MCFWVCSGADAYCNGGREAEVDRVMAEARALVEQLRADPARFAELAKEKSQDPGSAGNGGDLGFFARGMMVGAFEDAVFALDKGTIGEPVRSYSSFVHGFESMQVVIPARA